MCVEANRNEQYERDLLKLTHVIETAMAHLSSDFLDFFRELANNNHKEWFDANRKRYENNVKKPFENFIAEVIERGRKYDDALGLEPKDAIFRINRDIRFSKDKTPYKMNRTAIISPYGRKDRTSPGFYIYLGPDKVMMGGGAYDVPNTELANLRNALLHNYEHFSQIITEPLFFKHFGGPQGAEHKRLPKELGIAADNGKPLLYKKQLYFMGELPAESCIQEDFMDVVEQYFETMMPVTSFLREAM